MNGHFLFRFPSETNFCFILLIIAAFTVCVNISQNTERIIAIASEDSVKSDTPLLPMITGEKDKMFLVQEYAKPLIVPVASKMLLTVVSVFIYFCIPLVLLSRVKKPGKVSDNVSALNEYVNKCISSLGLRTRVLVNDSPLSANARAFGTVFIKYLKLDSGLALLLNRSKATFDAILFHELGHIVNKDVSVTYASISLWYSTAAIFVTAFSVSLIALFANSISDTGISFEKVTEFAKAVLQILLMLASVVYFRNSILRNREYYADLKSTQYGNEPALLKILDSAKPAGRGFFSNLMSLHPSEAQRADVLRNPVKLCLPGRSGAFFTGLLNSLIVNASTFPLLNFFLLISLLIFHESEFTGSVFDVFRFGISAILPAIIVFIFFLVLAITITGSVCMSFAKWGYAGGVGHPAAKFPAGTSLLISIMYIAGLEAGYLLQPFVGLAPGSAAGVMFVLLSDVMIFTGIFVMNLIFYKAGESLSKSGSNAAFKRNLYILMITTSIVLAFILLASVSLRVYFLFAK